MSTSKETEARTTNATAWTAAPGRLQLVVALLGLGETGYYRNILRPDPVLHAKFPFAFWHVMDYATWIIIAGSIILLARSSWQMRGARLPGPGATTRNE